MNHATTAIASAIAIRPIQAGDLPALKNFLSELSPGTLYFRFGRMSMPMWTADEWRTLCEPLASRCAHFVATQVSGPGRYRIVGMARLVVDAGSSRDCAEFSLVIADHLQNQGIGRQLMHALVGEASRRGLSSIYGDVLPSNTTMLSFCEGLGFVSRPSPDDARICRMVLSIRTQKLKDVTSAIPGSVHARVRLQA